MISHDIKIIKLLLDYGANVNYVNHINQTALSVHTKYSHTEIVELLFSHGAKY